MIKLKVSCYPSAAYEYHNRLVFFLLPNTMNQAFLVDLPCSPDSLCPGHGCRCLSSVAQMHASL